MKQVSKIDLVVLILIVLASLYTTYLYYNMESKMTVAIHKCNEYYQNHCMCNNIYQGNVNISWLDNQTAPLITGTIKYD